MTYEFITVSRNGPITTVTMNRPEVLNALHAPANYEMEAFFNEFAIDPDQWVVILTGSGQRAFSAGNDLKHQVEVGHLEFAPTGMGGLTGRFDMDKPVIAAVNGLAMGGGFEIALACDIIVAADHATFSLPEPKVGLAALGGGLIRLPAAIGYQRALAMILTSQVISAADAQAMGLVHQVTASNELMETALTIAEQLCEAGPLSIRASKAMVYAALGLGMREGFEVQRSLPAVTRMWESADAKEGPRAFAEKRKPVWTGR